MRKFFKKAIRRVLPKKAVNILKTMVNDPMFNLERQEIVSHLLSGEIDEALKKCRVFVHKNWERYPPMRIGDLELEGVNDVSRQVAAMDDVLVKGFPGNGDIFLYKVDFLQKYISVYGDYRIPHVLLAWEFLKHADHKKAIDWALAACALDERCMPSWYIMKTAFLALRDAGHLETCLSKEEISRLEPLGYDLRKKKCPLVFGRVFIQSTGEVMCCCPPLVPIAIGNVFEDPNWRAIVNSPSAKKIRDSIMDGSYKYCNRLTCQGIRHNQLYDKTFADVVDHFLSNRFNRIKSSIGTLNLGFDYTCNLRCPQCRSDFIHLTEERKNKLDHLAKKIIPDMARSAKEIVLANTGDPFASEYYRKILESISSSTHKNLKKITIFTNGLLFNRKMWERLSNIHPFRIGVAVSVDAATKKTYENVRPPGNWETLVENIEFISSLRKSNQIEYFEVEYVIQECNFREIRDFAIWAIKKLAVERVVFHRLINTGTFTPEDYKRRAVFDRSHPMYGEFINVLKDPIFSELSLNMCFTDLSHCLAEAWRVD